MPQKKEKGVSILGFFKAVSEPEPEHVPRKQGRFDGARELDDKQLKARKRGKRGKLDKVQKKK